MSWLHGLHGSCNLLVQKEILTEVLDLFCIFLFVGPFRQHKLASSCLNINMPSFLHRQTQGTKHRACISDPGTRCTIESLHVCISQRHHGLRFYRFYVMCSSACEHRYSTHRLADAVWACASGQKPVLDLTRSLTGSAKLGF